MPRREAVVLGFVFGVFVVVFLGVFLQTDSNCLFEEMMVTHSSVMHGGRCLSRPSS